MSYEEKMDQMADSNRRMSEKLREQSRDYEKLRATAENFKTAGDIIAHLDIPPEEVSILLINGFHNKPESEVKDEDIVALFPPVGGG